MTEDWSYDKKKRTANDGARWHFVMRSFLDEDTPYDERPYELYFRDDDMTQYGVIRFDRRKDNPYRDYAGLVNKIMNNAQFRAGLLNPETSSVWNRNWK
jgi:hypothetical protein